MYSTRLSNILSLLCITVPMIQSLKGQYFFIYIFFWPQVEVLFPFPEEILKYYTMILQRPRIIVEDAGFEPGTSAPEVWRATFSYAIRYCMAFSYNKISNEPPHFQRTNIMLIF